MQKFEVVQTETFTGVRIYRYQVEANNQDEALDIVMKGSVEPISFMEDFDGVVEDTEYEVIEAQ
jgi:hypothetical protein